MRMTAPIQALDPLDQDVTGKTLECLDTTVGLLKNESAFKKR
jgi:hypothetical protein